MIGTALRRLASFVLLVGSSAIATASTPYVITDGDGAVTVIHVTDALDVKPADNPTTAANGTLKEIKKGPHVGQLAFHGTLNGEENPDPNGIGWGVVAKAEAGNATLTSFAGALGNLQRVGQLLVTMDQECNTAAAASTELDAAIASLTSMKNGLGALTTAGDMTAKQAKAIGGTLDQIITLLGELKGDISNLLNDKTQTFEELVVKVAPLKKKSKKVKKLLKQLVIQLKATDVL